MKKNVTFSIDADLHKAASEYAKRNGGDLSAMITFLVEAELETGAMEKIEQERKESKSKAVKALHAVKVAKLKQIFKETPPRSRHE